MSVDDDGVEHSDDEVLVGRLVVLAADWAENGRLSATDFDQILDQVALPARLYQMVSTALADAGITVYAPTHAELGDDESDSDMAAVDGFGAFLRRTRHEVLTQLQEVELGRRIDAGRRAQKVLEEHPDLDPDSTSAFARQVRMGHQAENEFALNNVRLVVHMATTLRHRSTVGLDFEDLIEEGYIGLCRAIDKWDHTLGLKFSTYATWWIRQAMERAVADKGPTIRLPVHAVETLRQILKVETAIANAGRRPTINAIAERADLPRAKVRSLLEWRNRVDSLDRLVGAGNWALGDSIADRGVGDIEEAAELMDLRDRVQTLVASLSKREQEVIRLRFGLDDGRVRTLEEVGKVFGVTRERIRQIESQVLEKLKGPSRSLRTYLS